MPLKAWLKHRGSIVPGQHSMSAEEVRESQRARLLLAATELTAEHGINGVTAARLTTLSSVSRSTLYEIFESKDACLLTAADEAFEHLIESMSSAADAPGQEPPQPLYAAVDAFMRFCGEHPKAARLCLVELMGAGEAAMALRIRQLDRATELLREPVAAARPGTPRMLPELMIGAICEVACNRLRSGRAQELPKIGRELVEGMLGAQQQPPAG